MTAPKPVISALFLFNNRFERNVPVLEALYRERFSRRRYIMPFATEKRADVIPVREAGWYFSGHLAQASDRYIEPDVTHYVVISDDLFLNPALNESNLIERLGLGERSAWIKNLASSDALRNQWEWPAEAAFEMRRMQITDLFEKLPPAAEAQARFEKLGIRFRSSRPSGSAEWRYALLELRRRSRAIWLKNLALLGGPAPYPLLAGYADFLVIPAHAIERFAFYCGVLAAMNIFAEIAVPTALALACDDIVTELPHGVNFRDLSTRALSRGPYRGIEVEGEEAETFAAERGHCIERLQREFPADWLYLHPVKFSRWRSTEAAFAAGGASV